MSFRGWQEKYSLRYITCLSWSFYRLVCKIVKSDYWLLHVCPSERNNSSSTGQIFMKFDIWGFSENRSRKVKFRYNLTRITGTLHKDQLHFFIISRSLFLKMRNVSDKSCRENQNTHFVFKNCFSVENRAVYGIMWENIVEQDSPLMTIWRMHVAYWTPKATNIHSVCVILIAFRMQQWLHERASTLR